MTQTTDLAGYSLARAVMLAMAHSDAGRARGYQPPEDCGLELEASKYAAQTGAQGALGGIAIPEAILADQVIPAMQAASITSQAGARELTGVIGRPVVGVVSKRPAAAYVDQETIESPARTAAEFGVRTPRPHLLAAVVPLSWSMAQNTAGVMEQVIRTALAEELAAVRDHAALHGSGANGVPKGLANLDGPLNVSFSGATYTGAMTAANSAYFRVERMAWDTRIANARDNGSSRYGFLGEPTVGRKLAQGTANTGQKAKPAPAFAQGGELCGYPAFWSNVAAVDPETPQKGAGARLFFGDWSQLTHVVFGSMTIRVVEPTDAAERMAGVVHVIAHMPHDVMFGQLAAFARATDFAATLAT